MIFEEKPFSRYVVLTDQTALRLIVFTSWDIGQYMYCHYLFPDDDVINLKLILAFLLSHFLNDL